MEGDSLLLLDVVVQHCCQGLHPLEKHCLSVHASCVTIFFVCGQCTVGLVIMFYSSFIFSGHVQLHLQKLSKDICPFSSQGGSHHCISIVICTKVTAKTGR